MQTNRRRLLEHTELFLADPDDPMATGYWNQAVAMVGREDLIYQHTDDGDQRARPACADSQPGPLPVLMDAARQTSIVIINEHHARPGDRLFILELARALEGIGYKTYAAETFFETVSNAPGAPVTVDDGYFTMDPVYARLLSEVRQLGYQLVPYEQRQDQKASDAGPPESQIERREISQTDNLMAAIFDANPAAKIMIHVGHAHVAERPKPNENGIYWMAARLKEATGIDLLTISLTDCVADGTEPVLATAGKVADKTLRPVYTDYVVGIPRVTVKDGRPNYRRKAGDTDVALPDTLQPLDEPVLIEARRAGEADVVVPADRLFLRPGETLPLLLPEGRFEVRSFNREGLVNGPVMVTVPS